MGRPIDADALAEMFKTQYECETCDNYDGVRCRACHCDDALGIIDSAPTLDVQPVRRGEWVQKEIPTGYFTLAGNMPWVCSACEAIKSWDLTAPADNFCPNCGADMRTVSE